MIARKKIKLSERFLKRKSYVGAPNSNGYFFEWPAVESAMWSCRESYYNRDRTDFVGFWAANLTKDIKSVHDNLMKVETLLGLKTRSKLHKTTATDVVIIERCSFWNKNFLRRSAFTLFLRAFSRTRFTKDIWYPLRQYELTAECRPAIRAFLSGYTIPRFEATKFFQDPYENPGFVNKFKGLSLKKVKESLKKDATHRQPRQVKTMRRKDIRHRVRLLPGPSGLY